MKKIFFDTEFTSLNKDADLISLALVKETGESYHVRCDFDYKKCSDWVKENVLPNLPEKRLDMNELKAFIGIEPTEFWAYAGHYDWVLFCELFGGARSMPQNIYWLPKDWCDLAAQNGFPYDQNPLELFPQKGTYGALEDALALKEAVMSHL